MEWSLWSASPPVNPCGSQPQLQQSARGVRREAEIRRGRLWERQQRRRQRRQQQRQQVSRGGRGSAEGSAPPALFRTRLETFRLMGNAFRARSSKKDFTATSDEAWKARKSLPRFRNFRVNTVAVERLCGPHTICESCSGKGCSPRTSAPPRPPREHCCSPRPQIRRRKKSIAASNARIHES